MTNKNLVMSTLYKLHIPIISSEQIYKYWIKILNSYLNRSYHNFDHIAMGLKEIEKLSLNENIKYPAELKLAWITHDIIVGSRQAELFSAFFTQRLIHDVGLIVKEEIVYDLILETSQECYFSEGLSKTRLYEADLIHDIDFMIFGQDWEIFLKYDEDIEKEYGDRFSKLERAKFLRTMSISNHIYRLDFYRDQYEKKAINNLKEILYGKYLEEFKIANKIL
jgi:predicted metal-dependent HD superfamily phosphohydrolase